MHELALMIAAGIASGTPLLLAGLGLLLNERAGVVNLGAEGLMLIAAVAGFGIAFYTGQTWLALLGGALAAAVFSALLAWMVVYLNTNQYASGLALSLFGAGISAFVGAALVGKKLEIETSEKLPFLGDLPFFGPALFQQHTMVYIAVALCFGMVFFLYHTKTGRLLRGIGESPASAHALGYPVQRIRWLSLVIGGAFCGLAGAYLSVIYAPLWVEGMVAGRGWIALALTVFATWRPWRVLMGAYLFGSVTMLQLHLQAIGIEIPTQFMSMLPYVATIIVLALISRNPHWIRANMPASLGKPFHPG
ncbi:MAG: ABC transporter permease [Betaproteobacteria bacterium]